MNRTPFITADLRPDLSLDEQPDAKKLDEAATPAQLVEAARGILSKEEQWQIDRGACSKQEELMQVVPQPSPNVQGTTMEGETVLLDLNSGRYYTLNRVGTAVWEHCTGQRTLGDIHAVLCQRFEASSDRIADDLMALVTHLGHEGLLSLERR